MPLQDFPCAEEASEATILLLVGSTGTGGDIFRSVGPSGIEANILPHVLYTNTSESAVKWD